MPPAETASEHVPLPESSSPATHIDENDANLKFISRVDNWTQFKTKLRQMNHAYKQARFDTDLRDAALALHSFLRDQETKEAQESKETQEPKETKEFWKAQTLIYELNDIFHFDPEINDAALKQGGLVYDELRRLSLRWETLDQITDENRRLTREKVMFCACRGNELRRRGKPEAAARLFEWLLSFTSERLTKTESFPCFGTQAILTYHLGSVYRLLERHNLAEDTYTRTLEWLYEREKASNDHSDRLFTIRRQAMTIGIGYGWVNATRGSLKRAENALVTARSLLAGIHDPVVPSFIELLLGTIKRCRAGSNKANLQEAVGLLTDAKESLKAHGQARHVPRACWELSLAYHQLGDFDESEKQLEEVANYAEKVGHAKWQTNVRILRSRSLRKRGDHERALQEAVFAVEKAKDCESILPLTDAYITRGEARLGMIEARNDSTQSYEVARKDFEKALEKIGASRIGEKDANLPTNPKIVAVCELRIAQCFVRDGDEAKARSHFATWDILRGSVEHEWVRELAEEVKRDIEGFLMNFTISAKDPRAWNYARNVAQLRSWLLTQSLRHTKRNYSAAAEIIGVKRGTLYQWQDDSRSQTQRARTKASVPQTLDT